MANEECIIRCLERADNCKSPSVDMLSLNENTNLKTNLPFGFDVLHQKSAISFPHWL